MKNKSGSAVVIVVIIILTVSAYINSAVYSNNNFAIMNKKYDKILQDIYSKDTDSLSSVYEDLEKLYK